MKHLDLTTITREDRFTTRKTISANLETLAEIHRQTRTTTDDVNDTIRALVDRLGYDTAVVTVADLVNTVSPYDGRIYDRTREWAASVDEALDYESLYALSICQPSNIHSCHVDQLGRAMRDYTPAEPTETETPGETGEREKAAMTHTNKEIIINEAIEAIRNEAASARSAWSRGVAEYAIDLVNELAGQMVRLDDPETLEAAMLNGAASWKQYSEGGCSLIYDGDIARRLCSYSELVRTKEGQHRPNARESWLDVQARALAQAAKLAKKAITSAASAALA